MTPTSPRDPFDRIADALDALVALKRQQLGLPLPNDAPEPEPLLDGIDDYITIVDDATSADTERARLDATRQDILRTFADSTPRDEHIGAGTRWP